MEANHGEGSESYEGARLTIIQHLEELRNRLIIAGLALLVMTVVSFLFTGRLMEVLLLRAPEGTNIIFVRPTEMFVTYFKVALVGGLALSMPVIIYQLIRFAVPGLKPNEKRWLYFIVPGASALFILGVTFCYMVLLPFALRYLLTFGAGIADPFISIGEFISFVVTLMIWMGIAFELPMVVVFLSKLGVVTPQQLRAYWKYALVGSFAIAAIITPTPDPFNQTLVAVPLYLLYEIGVLFARIVR
jgi:sec-independent protein translocase protein TatC